MFTPRLSAERIRRHTERGEWPVAGLSALLDERVRASRNALFIVDGDARLTFGAFAQRVARLAAGLSQCGIGAGDVVAWQLPSWWEAAVLAVAIDHVGAISNPIIPIYREREVGFVCAQARARMLVIPGTYRRFDYRELAHAVRRTAPTIEHIVVVRDTPGAGMHAMDGLFGSDAPTRPQLPARPHEVAYLFYTSGTTAEPKGVMHTCSTLGAYARSNTIIAGAQPDAVGLLQFPLSHIGGIGSFLVAPLLTGARVVFLDPWDPERAIDLIEREHVTSAGGPPAILQGMLNARGFAPERVRTVRVAGTGAADVPPELIRTVRERFAAHTYRSYGLTECPMMTSGVLGDSVEHCTFTDGRAAPGCTVRIVDKHGTVVPANVEGEVEGFGPQMCVGYSDAALNNAAFTNDGFVRTGDLAVMDADGYVRITGRKKDIIIRKGENLSAKAIEDVLHEHAGIAEAAVIGVPDPTSGERVCACVVLRDGATPMTLDELRRFMEDKQVMRQKIPEQLELLSQLPRTATGKVLKYELRKRFAARS